MKGIKERLMKQVADPAENEQFRALAGAFVTLELDQRRRLQELADALDEDPEDLGIETLEDHEERIDELLAGITARMNDNAWGMWVEHLAPEALKNPDRAAQYAGLDEDDWEGEIEDWAERIRDQTGTDTDGRTDRDLAAAQVYDAFGLSLKEFEREVVDWRPGEAYEEAFAGSFKQHNEAISRLAESVE